MTKIFRTFNVSAAALFLVLTTTQSQASKLAESANLKAPQGGNMVYNLGAEPPSIHPITSSDLSSRWVKNFVCEGLFSKDYRTWANVPGLAERWEISKDNKVFTFFLRKDAVFHNGEPVTAEDVKFSFDAILDPKYEALNLASYFDKLEKVEIVDPHTVRMTMKEVYFKNFDVMGWPQIISKKAYGDIQKSKTMSRTAICTGPYKVEKFDRGQSIVVRKFKDWYGFKPENQKTFNTQGAFNFETITFRFFKEANIALERLKRGDIDYHWKLEDRDYATQTKGDPWGKSVFAVAAESKQPKRYNFVGWNFKNPIFQDLNVRKALTHLANREEMNKKFQYGLSLIASTGVSPLSDQFPPDLKPLPYNPTIAQELLKKAGWADTDKDGLLDKVINGKKTPFEFSVIHASRDGWDRPLLFFQEDLKKVGIKLNVTYLEWNSLQKAIDDYKFDAVAMSWGGGDVESDPRQIWHSSSSAKGGSNFISYSNKEVDRLMDKARVEVDPKKRQELFRNVYKKIGEDVPYLFLFSNRYTIYARSAKMGVPGDTFQYDVGPEFWWRAP